MSIVREFFAPFFSPVPNPDAAAAEPRPFAPAQYEIAQPWTVGWRLPVAVTLVLLCPLGIAIALLIAFRAKDGVCVGVMALFPLVVLLWTAARPAQVHVDLEGITLTSGKTTRHWALRDLAEVSHRAAADWGGYDDAVVLRRKDGRVDVIGVATKLADYRDHAPKIVEHVREAMALQAAREAPYR